MRVTIMFLLHFLLIKRNYRAFYLPNFLFDADQNAPCSLVTYLRFMQFSYTEIGNFPEDFIPLNEMSNFDTPRWATFMKILCF